MTKISTCCTCGKQWQTGTDGSHSCSTNLLRKINFLEQKLLEIAQWKLPHTGKYWDDNKTRPMSYGACYGSNGERDYFKRLASESLHKVNEIV